MGKIGLKSDLMDIYQMILGSRIRIVTTSFRFFIPSKTSSSKTVVNSFSIEVNKATRFKESTLSSCLRSASNFTLFNSRISKSRINRRILVSI